MTGPDVSGVWRYDPSTVIADPGSGFLRTDGPPVTRIAVSTTRRDGSAAQPALSTLLAGSDVLLQEQADATLAVRYLFAADATSHGTWVEAPVTVAAASPGVVGPPHANTDLMLLGYAAAAPPQPLAPGRPQLLPDAERLVVDYLLAADLSAAETVDGTVVDIRALVGSRIYSVRPNRADYPLVTVHRWGGAPQLRRPRDRDEAWLQLDCWGGTKNEAWVILDACVSALCNGLVGEHPAGVVSRVDPATFWDLPDVDFEPPKPRWACDVMVATRGRRTA